MKKIQNLEEFYDIVENTDKVIVYWYTKWCPDCFFSKTYLGKLENEFSDYEFIKIDRDRLLDLARHLEIFGIPSFLVFNEGNEVGRFVDKNRKTFNEVKTFINSVINK